MIALTNEVRNKVPRANLNIDRVALEDFCRRHRIRRPVLTGSVLRDDFRPESDVDVLVEFEEGQSPGFGYVRVQEELAGLPGRRVDLNTPGSLSDHLRDEVQGEAELLHVSTS